MFLIHQLFFSGKERPKHGFIFTPVSFDLILSRTSKEVLPIFFKLHNRSNQYCPLERKRQLETFPSYKMSLLGQRSHRHLDDDVPAKSSIAAFEELFARCNFPSALTTRTSCRNNVRAKCRNAFREESHICDAKVNKISVIAGDHLIRIAIQLLNLSVDFSFQ
jgi:hypothetical protein